MTPARSQNEPASPAKGAAQREGRLFITLPRLIRERLRVTIEARGWIDADGQPARGAEVDLINEWLMEYALIKGWTGEAPAAAPAAATSTPPMLASPTSRSSAPLTPATDDDDFGFRD